MGLRKYPPLPSRARPLVWTARVFGVVAFAVGIHLAWRAAADGRTVLALLFLAIALAYVLGTWVNPLSPVLWVAIGAVVALIHDVLITLGLFSLMGKEISLEDVRLSLEKLPDRFVEHPASVFVFTNMYYSEAPWLEASK